MKTAAAYEGNIPGVEMWDDLSSSFNICHFSLGRVLTIM
jgi:carbonic anhydrase